MRNLKMRIENLGSNYKKEMSLLLIELLGSISISLVGYFVIKNNLFLLLGVGVFVIFLVLFFFRINNKEKLVSESKINDFINYFSYFRIYIYNGESVYSSFLKTSNFASDTIKPLIEKIIDDINVDKTITPYINFAKNFDEKIIEQIMISIFEMVDNGNNVAYINQFSTIFENFKSRSTKLEENKRNDKFDLFINSALIGSGVIMIILVFGIVNLVGEIL